MTTGQQLIVPGSDYDRAIRSSEALRLMDAARKAFARVVRPHADKTHEAYDRHWDTWALWCERTGARVLPVEPAALVAHLEWLSGEGLAPNTVRQALSAIASLDRASRVTPTDPNPQSVRRTVVVQNWHESWSRENPIAPRKQAPALEPRELRRVLELAGEGPGKHQARGPYVARYARDRALLLLGVYSARRVSEICALELEHVLQGERGLTLRIVRSKTDQQGEGHRVGLLPQGELALCPVEAYQQWLRVRGPQPGPVFVEITRAGELGREQLTERSANRIVQRLARRAGVALVSSHSMRATFVTMAVRRKVPLPDIARHAGMVSIQTVTRYARQATLFDDNPTAGLLDER